MHCELEILCCFVLSSSCLCCVLNAVLISVRKESELVAELVASHGHLRRVAYKPLRLPLHTFVCHVLPPTRSAPAPPLTPKVYRVSPLCVNTAAVVVVVRLCVACVRGSLLIVSGPDSPEFIRRIMCESTISGNRKRTKMSSYILLDIIVIKSQ